jgi:hypothetical protein
MVADSRAPVVQGRASIVLQIAHWPTVIYYFFLRFSDMLRALIASINGHIFATDSTTAASSSSDQEVVSTPQTGLDTSHIQDAGWQSRNPTQNQGIHQSSGTLSDTSLYYQYEHAAPGPYGSPSHGLGTGAFNIHANGTFADFGDAQDNISRLSYPTSQSYATYFQQRFDSHILGSYHQANANFPTAQSMVCSKMKNHITE